MVPQIKTTSHVLSFLKNTLNGVTSKCQICTSHCPFETFGKDIAEKEEINGSGNNL